jgi:hypothetical protein
MLRELGVSARNWKPIKENGAFEVESNRWKVSTVSCFSYVFRRFYAYFLDRRATPLGITASLKSLLFLVKYSTPPRIHYLF